MCCMTYLLASGKRRKRESRKKIDHHLAYHLRRLGTGSLEPGGTECGLILGY